MFIKLVGHNERNAVENTALLFFPVSHFSPYEDKNDDGRTLLSEYFENGNAKATLRDADGEVYAVAEKETGDDVSATVARAVYFACNKKTGKTSPWGTLTGIRPVKKAIMLFENTNSEEKTKRTLTENYLVSDNKADVSLSVMRAEKDLVKRLEDNTVSLYISIPFCPTRCKYCSFVSQSIERAQKLLPAYTDCLCEELKLLGEMLKRTGKRVLTAYMGGGTPTTLSAEQLGQVLSAVRDSFDLSALREFTVEAGRPDTITAEKLNVLSSFNIDRISINPQTMNDKTLERIGRKHTSEQLYNAYDLARKAGFSNINMDLIAGLEGETLGDFEYTLSKVLDMAPDSVTVHALAIKRAAALSAFGESALEGGAEATKMVELSQTALPQAGYRPYYLYRQKNMIGNLENVGYAKKGKECLYNVFIMGEYQTIAAAGAGAVGKYVDAQSGRIERIFNFKYPYEYIDNFSRAKENVTALETMLEGLKSEEKADKS